MCSIFVRGNEVFLNRDEARSRDKEQAPGFHWGKEIFGPRDTTSGGTWFAVNNRGEWAAILNNYQDPYIGSKSRGEIVLRLLEGEPLAEIAKDDYSSFFVYHNGKLLSSNLEVVKMLKKSNVQYYTSSSFKLAEAVQHRDKQVEAWTEGFPEFYRTPGTSPYLDVLIEREQSRSTSVIHFDGDKLAYFPVLKGRALGEVNLFQLSRLF